MENIVYKIFEQDYRDECDNLASILEEHDYKYYSSNNVKQKAVFNNFLGGFAFAVIIYSIYYLNKS